MKKFDFSNVKVLVCGDAMLDRYWFGDADRLSPEAPVPIVKIVREEKRLGGAANVALNIAKLGAKCILLSVCGEDNAGKEFRNLLNVDNVTPSLIVDHTVPTIEKLRIIARQQQMLRADFEQLPCEDALIGISQNFRKLISQVSIVVLSDYRKGVLSNVASMITSCKEKKIPVLIDPKGDDWSAYRGATLITPNKSELKRIVGSWRSEADLRLRTQRLRESLELEYILLTRSEEGMTLFSADEEINFKAQAREVFDVSGAGDTVIAVLATLLGAGVPLHESVRLSNKAGGIVVGKLGTAAITLDELMADEPDTLGV
ncbi:D-glycero-beta-D-manno-heptose-7-phosphate kinase [Mesosutterella sp. OilRF-GAM-744-9]|uniref:D-glycero-beta-D-manno-heptose-7-phosphate kinase n=2 Tax=Mesosutterella TaxID=2494213 RepID=A0ABS9MSJ4_9BURK|nr:MULTISPECIES: D-glycero-beta-D-manno-heptose-7-phosphate kinase [unclassified Mesosutterella]MCG5031357.1 D-glycero-beta-D-manno-heptose-7-phosphate kinase [Mesosutterella sp. oilRF-744-WT-GAM-9]MDL2059477.1 D-glycero-beta-D-manno-heptose-7-phosphate kinase [Mesosutterella sp. AGMB02718]